MRTVTDRYERLWTEIAPGVWETEGLKWTYTPPPQQSNPLKQQLLQASEMRQVLSAFNAMKPADWIEPELAPPTE